jgi:hypothetical protein
VKKDRISSRAAMVGWPASSIRWAVTTLWGTPRGARRMVRHRCGLGENRCQQRGLQHHREREVPGEAHADGADSGSAAFQVCKARQRPVDREPSVADPAGKACDMRTDARHLGHDDHTRSRAGDVHPLGHAIERDLATGKVLDRIVFFHAAYRHGRCPLSPMDLAGISASSRASRLRLATSGILAPASPGLLLTGPSARPCRAPRESLDARDDLPVPGPCQVASGKLQRALHAVLDARVRHG